MTSEAAGFFRIDVGTSGVKAVLIGADPDELAVYGVRID